jgi:hypothetical protein
LNLLVFAGEGSLRFGKSGLYLSVMLCAGSAQAATFDCAIKAGADSGGWITDRYVFDVDDAAGSAQAADAIAQHFTGGPVNARLTDSTSKKIVISWGVQMTNGSGQQTKMQYRAAIFLADKSVIVTAAPGGGYSNRFEARGKCQ